MSESAHNEDLTQFSVEHRARRLTHRVSPEAPSPRRSIVRDLLFLGGVLAVGLLLTPFSDVPNTAYPEARAIADRLDSAYGLVWGSDVSLETAAGTENLVVYAFPVGDRTISVLTHAQPTAAGMCYGLRLGGGSGTVAVRYLPSDGCVPQGQFAFEAVGSWEDALGTERKTTVWFVPALIFLFGIGVALVTSIVLKLLPRGAR